MEIKHNYRDDEKLRNSFNELAGKVFGLSFEGWYQNGFWKDNYEPYSIIEDGKVVSNVSVNRCDMNYGGKVVRLLQIGTVMTDPDYRGKGYARAIMEKVLADYEGKVDGIYLYANDSVTEFYPKFGFTEGKEYQYSKVVNNGIAAESKDADKVQSSDTNLTAAQVPMSSKEDWEKMCKILDSTPQNAKMYMVNNSGLYMFYLSQFMQENTYFIDSLNTYAIAEIEDDTLILHAIIGEGGVDDVISAFGKEIKKAVLNFTPNDTNGFEKSELIEEDTHFFAKGAFFKETEGDAYMFQAITHA